MAVLSLLLIVAIRSRRLMGSRIRIEAVDRESGIDLEGCEYSECGYPRV